jgi:RNA polymerase sigma-70 factor (ECF subfamily)
MIDPFEEEKALIQACQRGEEKAYWTLVERYQNRAYWAAYNFVRNREDAQDIVQEAFVRVYKNIQRFHLDKTFETWLYRIVVNLAIDALRKRKIQKNQSVEELPEVESTESADHSLEREESSQQIYKVLDQLPEKYRQILTLRDLEGLSSKQISEILGYNHATIRWYLHIARKMFKAHWVRLHPES